MKQGVKFFIITIILVGALVGAYFAYTNISSNTAEITKKQSEAVVKKYDATDIKLVDENGIDVRLSDKKGKPVVINFWATWCSYCVHEMPVFESAYKKYGDDAEFMMINLTDGERETVKSAKKFISSQKYTFPVYYDTYGDALNSYNAYNIPITIFVNADGTVFDKHIGAFDEESFNAKLEQFLSVQ